MRRDKTGVDPRFARATWRPRTPKVRRNPDRRLSRPTHPPKEADRETGPPIRYKNERAANAGDKASVPNQLTIPGSCPSYELALTPESVARAADQARIEAPAIYGRLGAGARIQAADIATTGNAGSRGEQVRHQCGERVAERTIVVELFLPKGLPSASLSQGTLFVSRFSSGYRVWEVAH
jgi:hypothetical protein